MSDGRTLFATVSAGEMAVQPGVARRPGTAIDFPALQIILNKSDGGNQTYVFADEKIIAAYAPGGGDPTKQFDIFPKLKSKSEDPTTFDLPEGYFGVFENSNDGSLKLWCNQGGTLKSITFS